MYTIANAISIRSWPCWRAKVITNLLIFRMQHNLTDCSQSCGLVFFYGGKCFRTALPHRAICRLRASLCVVSR